MENGPFGLLGVKHSATGMRKSSTLISTCISHNLVKQFFGHHNPFMTHPLLMSSVHEMLDKDGLVAPTVRCQFPNKNILIASGGGDAKTNVGKLAYCETLHVNA